MIATRVYGKDGSYLSDGERDFIEVNTGERLPVVLNVYCADFEKDNPSSNESFAIRSIPQDLEAIARSISEYEESNLESNVIVGAQLALWLSQGITLEEISEKFSYVEIDKTHMRAIIDLAN